MNDPNHVVHWTGYRDDHPDIPVRVVQSGPYVDLVVGDGDITRRYYPDGKDMTVVMTAMYDQRSPTPRWTALRGFCALSCRYTEDMVTAMVTAYGQAASDD